MEIEDCSKRCQIKCLVEVILVRANQTMEGRRAKMKRSIKKTSNHGFDDVWLKFPKEGSDIPGEVAFRTLAV